MNLLKKAMMEGIESPSIRILAGLGANGDSLEKVKYLTDALNELGIILPNKRTACLQHALYLANEILTGKLELMPGMRQIMGEAIRQGNFYEESAGYCYDSIGFAYLYGRYDTHDELSSAKGRWSTEKTNDELLTELEAEIRGELEKWRDELASGKYVKQ